MTNVKEQILSAVNTLPDDATWDDALYTLYLHYKLKKSEEDIKNNRVMSLRELKNYIKELESEYEHKNIE